MTFSQAGEDEKDIININQRRRKISYFFIIAIHYHGLQ